MKKLIRKQSHQKQKVKINLSSNRFLKSLSFQSRFGPSPLLYNKRAKGRGQEQLDHLCATGVNQIPSCFSENRRSDFHGCVEDERYPYQDIFSAVMRFSCYFSFFSSLALNLLVFQRSFNRSKNRTGSFSHVQPAK